jgi:hypothetical protein
MRLWLLEKGIKFNHMIHPLIWFSLMVGQLQNFGGGTDPEEKKRSQRTIAQNDQMIRLNRWILAVSVVAVVVAIVALVVAVVALKVQH